MDKLILPVIHLSVLLGFIIYKAKAPFVEFMKKRHQDVSDGLNQAKIQAAQVDTKKREVEAKFASLQKEKEVIFSDWKERQEAQIKAVKESSVKLLSQMKVESAQNTKSLEEQCAHKF